MRFIALLLLVLWIHLGDLGSAWLYDGGAWSAAGMLRYFRDAMIVLIAGCCLISVRMPMRLLLPILSYSGLALLYLLLNRGNAPLSILIGSYGTLMIPVLLFLVGFYCVRRPAELSACTALMVVLGIASMLFGAWELRNTTFWTDTISFPSYMLNVKGMLLGANPENGLPWNFYGGVERERRAAGLLASPLAQGMFLAVVAITSVAWLERRARYYGLLLCALLFVGIWMSGTRGAMLAASLALVGYLATGSSLFYSPAARLVMTGGAFFAIVVAAKNIVHTSVNFLDGSTIGHWVALQKNIIDLPQVALIGAGLGQQGAVAAQKSQMLVGGGEGAFFSIAFQLGLPGALLFLWFYSNVSIALWSSYRQHREPMSLATFWLSLGIATTLISSEHVLSVSGTAAFWLLCGATVRSTPKATLYAAPTYEHKTA